MRSWIVASAVLLAACGGANETMDDVQVEPAPIETPAADAPISFAENEAELDANLEQSIGSMNPLENDLQDLEVLVRLKDEFVLTDKGADFVLKATMSNGDVPVDEVLKLQRVTDIKSNVLTEAAREGFYIAQFRLFEADKARIEAAQAILKELQKTSDGNNDLAFNAVAYTCVAAGVEPSDTYSLTIFVRTHPSVEFISLGGEVLVERSDQSGIAELWNVCEP